MPVPKTLLVDVTLMVGAAPKDNTAAVSLLPAETIYWTDSKTFFVSMIHNHLHTKTFKIQGPGLKTLEFPLSPVVCIKYLKKIKLR